MAKSTKRAKPGKAAAEAAHRRVLFVEAYMANGGNATQAAIAAGFSEASAGQRGYELLNEPAVAETLAARRKALQEAHGLTTERVLLELRRLALVDPRKLFGEDGNPLLPHELDDDTAAALAGVDVEELFEGRGDERVQIGNVRKFKLWDKGAALERAMKHLGLFERDNAQTKQSITIVATTHDVNL